MNVLGLSIRRAQTDLQQKQTLTVVDGWRSFGNFLRACVQETSPGGWQRNEDISLDTVLSHPTVYRCLTLIQTDLGKMRLRLTQPDDRGFFVETTSPAYSPVLRKPNHFQTRQQFIEAWVNSKLLYGNTYVLKYRDQRGVVIAMYVLDPSRVTTLVAPDGSVFYELSTDELMLLGARVRVPARELIHDRMPALFHQLFGVSPFYAAGEVILQGLNISSNASSFFANGAQPGGLLTSEREIEQVKAERYKDYWETAFSGTNAGKVAVLGGNVKYTPLEPMRSSDAQMMEQLGWVDEKICSAFGMPPHKVGVGDQPNYNNIEALNQQYWAECLQVHAEAIQTLLAEGLQTSPYEIRFETTDLLRMDTPTMVKAAADGVKAGFLSPNEARRMFFNLPPVAGGESPYLQQQDFSLAALARRDAATPAPPSLPAGDVVEGEVVKHLALRAQAAEPLDDGETLARHVGVLLTKHLAALTPPSPPPPSSPPRVRKRVVRDEQGRVESIIEEPAA